MTKYVTQGEREMVEAVMQGTSICECSDHLLEETSLSGIHLGRPASQGSGLAIYYVTDAEKHRSVMLRTHADGSAAQRGVDFASDDLMERGQRIATRAWVTEHTREARVFASDWLVASDTVIGSVLFENVGEREFEYQPRDGVQVTFYPRTSEQNLPMPWSTIQQRIVGYGTTGPRIHVRCIADDGTKTPFVAVVTNEAP